LGLCWLALLLLPILEPWFTMALGVRSMSVLDVIITHLL
jgi:hypothetical protein